MMSRLRCFNCGCPRSRRRGTAYVDGRGQGTDEGEQDPKIKARVAAEERLSEVLKKNEPT
jgi:hypothetical protein